MPAACGCYTCCPLEGKHTLLIPQTDKLEVASDGKTLEFHTEAEVLAMWFTVVEFMNRCCFLKGRLSCTWKTARWSSRTCSSISTSWETASWKVKSCGETSSSCRENKHCQSLWSQNMKTAVCTLKRFIKQSGMFTEPDFAFCNQESCSYWTYSVKKQRTKFTVLCTETGFVLIRV